MTAHGLLARLLAAGLLLGGCAGTAERATPPLSERESLERSARLAFEQGQYDQAARLYEAVLQAALGEDAPQAIIDARFNLALCRTNLGDYAAALRQTDRAEDERRRRGLPIDPQLQLLVGTIHYRAGDREHAQALLAGVLDSPGVSLATRARARFIAGLIAADQAAQSALRGHIGALGVARDSASQADYLELLGRLSGLQGDIDGALQQLDQAADLRSLERDYRGMARALASAGILAEQAGRLQAAGNYLFRAGRSAALRAEPEARQWLDRARDIGARSGDRKLVEETDAILRRLDASD